MTLTLEEKFKIISGIETGQYSSQAALDNLQNIVYDIVEIRIEGPRFTAMELQIIYNLIKLMESKI